MFSIFIILLLTVELGVSALILTPDNGKLSGRGMYRHTVNNRRAIVWERARAYIFWDIQFSQAGTVQVSFSMSDVGGGNQFQVQLQGSSNINATPPPTGNPGAVTQVNIGNLNVPKAGKYQFKVEAMTPGFPGYLYSVSLSGPASAGAQVVDVYRLQPYSTHLTYLDSNANAFADALMYYNDVTVTSSTYSTYISACAFDVGYFGIQEISDYHTGVMSKIAIFSIWGVVDAEQVTPQPDEYADVVALGANVNSSDFGGEGTGMKTMMPFNWQIGQKVEFLVTVEKGQGQYVHYSGYLFYPQNNQWKFIATLKRKNPKANLNDYYSFLEDWEGGMGHVPREASFNPWIKANDGTWVQAPKAKFTSSNASATDTANLNGWNKNGRFFMRTGGDTTNTVKNDNSTVTRIPDGLRPNSLKDIENVLKNKTYIK